MRFTPKTEDQLKTENLIPEDTQCDFEVVEANHKVSKKGNDMIALKLRVFAKTRETVVFDYLLESMGFKLLHFCEAANLTAKYASGNLLAQDCLGKTGRCVVGIEEASGSYPAKNVVSDYIGHRETKSVSLAPVKPVSAIVISDDDVPF